MTWTYSDPSSSPKDAVRFLVGDTDEDDQLIQDQEIEFFLDEFNDTYLAAASTAEAIASAFAREVAHSGDGLSYSGNQLQQHYAEMAERLRFLAKRKARQGAEPYAGGISWREREKDDNDSDLITTSFRSHMHDYPGTRDSQRGGYRDPLKGEDR